MRKWLYFVLVILLLVNPQVAFAHSFGALYNLPVPFWMYLYGGAAALIVSFLIIGYFINKAEVSTNYKTYDLSRQKIFSIFTNKIFILALKIIGVLLFLLTIFSGFIGQDYSYSNFNMAFFWIIFVLGLTYATALFGNIYEIINPWKTIVEWIEALLGEKFEGIVKYPKNLGYYPALIFYFLFIYVELFGQVGPFKLSFILTQYTIVTFFGAFLIGKDKWFTYGEFFSVFFRQIACLAPLECSKNKLLLRPPFAGLLKEKAEHFSLLLFVLFMLSSTAFDGFKQTTVWYRIYWQHLDSFLKPFLGDNSFHIFAIVGLLLSPFVFLLIYLVFLAFAKIITKTKISVFALALQFAFSLVPIAFVYNVAHYYTLILTEGQNFIKLISDPFGFGWNLFGTANFIPNLNVIDAGVTWHVQVAAILLGHITGVFAAHIIALNVFPTHKKALLSQIPMLFIMVAYTIIGLWILAQPVTGGAI